MQTEAQKPPVIERVKSYEDACKELNRQPVTLDQFSFLPEHQRQYANASHRVLTFVEAMNEGHEFDYNNISEGKYYPWWDMEDYEGDEAGSGFRFDGTYCALATAHVGARLSMRSREHAAHAAECMLEDYRILMKGQPKQ